MVPKGWSHTLFGDLAKVVNGYAFQSSDFVEKSETSVPIIRMSSLNAGVIDLTDTIHVAEEKTKGLEKFLLREGDFVFGMSGSISNFAVIRKQDGICYQNQRVGRLSPIKASREFVSQLFLSEGVTRQIERLAAGGAQLNISSSQIENLVILNPPLPEQKKIASILTSVDEVIETTQRQIDKLQDLKKATMNELLTKGIGHTDFKDSELGKIPKSWEIQTLSELSDIIDPHPSHRAPPELNEGVPFLGIGDLDMNGDIASSKTRLVSRDEIPRHRKRYQITSNSIGFGRVASIGKIIDFRKAKKNILISPTLAIIEPRDINKKFLVNFLKSIQVQNQINNFITGSTRSSLGIQLLRELFILVPPEIEQLEIAKKLTSLDNAIATIYKKKEKYKNFKKSLMQSLLTGKVRVKIN